MSPKPTRRRRGDGVRAVALYVDVDRDVKAEFDRIVAETGTSKWAMIEAMVTYTAHVIDSGERPQWLPRTSDQEELPLTG